MRLVKEHGHSSVCRRSVIESEDIALNVGGQDLGALYLEVLAAGQGRELHGLSHREGFPIVGDVLNRRSTGGDRAAPAPAR